MPRKRNPENKGLPNRWRYRSGAYYYQVPAGMEQFWDGKREFRLGKSLPEAYRTWAARIGYMDKVRTIGQLLERYEREVIPTKAASTRVSNAKEAPKLRAVFGDMPITALQPHHIYRYYDERGKTGGYVSARHEIALLSHAFTKAVEWGYIARHPFKGQVRLKGTKARDRYVEDWEIEEVLSIRQSHVGTSAIPVLQAYIRLKRLIGLRKSDMLRLKESDCAGEEGIAVTPSKTRNSTGKKIIVLWTDELRTAVAEAIAVRPVYSELLFCTRNGKSYIDERTGATSGFDSMWQRFMKKALKETELKQSFTEHDIRAKTASDIEDSHASRLLGHADSKITRKHYRRAPEKVLPASASNRKECDL